MAGPAPIPVAPTEGHPAAVPTRTLGGAPPQPDLGSVESYGTGDTAYALKGGTGVTIAKSGNALEISFDPATVPAADIPISAIAEGPADTVLTTNSAGTAPQWSKIADANVDAAAGVAYSKLGTPDGADYITPQTFQSINDAKGTLTDQQPENVQTTNATVTTIQTFALPSDTTTILTAVITAIKDDMTVGAAYVRTAAFRNNAGAVAQIGATQDGGTFEDDSAWDATVDFSGTSARVRVTGAAATNIRWSSVFSALTVLP